METVRVDRQVPRELKPPAKYVDPVKVEEWISSPVKGSKSFPHGSDRWHAHREYPASNFSPMGYGKLGVI